MLINDNGTQVDGVEHYFQTDTDSGSKNISIIDTRGGTDAEIIQIPIKEMQLM